MGKKVRCAVCVRLRDEENCEGFKPTEREKLLLLKSGAKSIQPIYYYCRPCMRILRDPEAGKQILGGVVQSYARAMGAVNSEEFAERFKERLAKLPREVK